MKELKQYMEQSFEEKKTGVLSQIEEYLKYKYPSITVIYKGGEFIISGDIIESEKCRKEIREILDFARKN